MIFSAVSASCRYVPFCNGCDSERRNHLIQENFIIHFNCFAFSFSTAHSFRKLSLQRFWFKTILAELFPWRTLKISEIFSFIKHRSFKLCSYHYNGEALQPCLHSVFGPWLGTAGAGQQAQSTPAPSLPLWGEQSCLTAPQLQRGLWEVAMWPYSKCSIMWPFRWLLPTGFICFNFIYWIITSPTVWGGYSEELLSSKLPCTVFSVVLCHRREFLHCVTFQYLSIIKLSTSWKSDLGKCQSCLTFDAISKPLRSHTSNTPATSAQCLPFVGERKRWEKDREKKGGRTVSYWPYSWAWLSLRWMTVLE